VKGQGVDFLMFDILR